MKEEPALASCILTFTHALPLCVCLSLKKCLKRKNIYLCSTNNDIELLLIPWYFVSFKGDNSGELERT